MLGIPQRFSGQDSELLLLRPGFNPWQRPQCAAGSLVLHTVVFGKTRMGLQDGGYVGNFCLFALPIIILLKVFQNNFLNI